MKFKTSGILCASLLVLSACSSNGGLFGNKAADDAAKAAAANAAASNDAAISETSIAFFNSSVGDRVLFPVDQSILSPVAVATLDAQVEWLMANPQFTARIEGHADEQGTRDYNIALGDRRATAVYNYLISKGIAASRLSTISFGKENPLAICSDESCWSKNRRAVTAVAGGFTG